ncbi:PRC-barrel domain-containing protein [uncultured Jannaschia sp.]|uniref:PRC-barrel domain-containing protein n=1 Tax=uncultured Jannaschia sp. TaxID=293347 RepID=UPI002636C36D|nr:PRC-barrel domain-containing protein [uncultured Jannaschia sp.]
MMKSLILAALTLPLAGATIAQTTDISGYADVDNLDVIGADGERIGEVETMLVDDAGMPAALVVEVDDGFLDLGDSDVVVMMDALTWDNGRYTTMMTADEVEGLPVWDD